MISWCVIWICCVALGAFRPVIMDLISLSMGWDMIVPDGDLKGWTLYLVWTAMILFMMGVVSWYHCKISHYREKQKRDYIWWITMVMESFGVLFGEYQMIQFFGSL